VIFQSIGNGSKDARLI